MSFSMKECGSNAKGLGELNQFKGVEQSNYRDGNSKEGHGLSEEDESRISKDFGDDRSADIVLAGTDRKKIHQQSQGSSICWDRFLPTRSIKVMLVENDESTRHVVSALLQNCSYQVTAVANGMQAWKILEGPSNQIDIVIAELNMPGLSGISLLQKIKDHETLKNLPVIITSSQDSMGIVFNCLSKGAVDFLVKPIRKNELKNLWQHVWRKLNYSSGSGSESVKQTKGPAKSTGVEESNNNDSNVIGDDNGSTGLNNRDGSDHGSNTESCWERSRVEFHRAPPVVPGDQSTNPLSSICAQANCSTTEAFASSWKPAATKEFQDIDCDNSTMGKDLEMGCRSMAALENEYPNGKVLRTACDGEKTDGKIRQAEMDRDAENDEPSAPAADLMSLIAKNNVANAEGAFSESLDGTFMADETNGKTHASQELLFLELSLKQVGDSRTVETYDHNPIRRSHFSAFTRYSSNATANQTPSGNVGSCSPPDNSSEAAKGESTHDFQSKSSGTLLKQSSNGSTDNNDKGSTTCTAPNNSFKALKDTRAIRTINSNHSTSAFKRVENCNSNPLQPTNPNKGNTVAVAVQAKETQANHHRQNADNLHPHQKKQKRQDDCTTEVSNLVPLCQVTNYFNTTTPGAISANGQSGIVAPGCYISSGGQNAKHIDISTTDTATDMDRRNAIVNDGGKSFCAVAGIPFPSRLDALNKYRQKKKDRCFRKKVRYQSRKQLAEQRPRVKGQFVRQAVYNNNHAKDQIS